MASGGTPERPHRPGAAAWLPARRSLRALREAVQGCRGCELDLTLTRPPAWTLATAHPSSVLRSRGRERDRALLVADLRVAATSLHPT